MVAIGNCNFSQTLIAAARLKATFGLEENTFHYFA